MGKVNSSSISGASRIRAGQGICVLRQGILGHFRPLLDIFGAKGLFKDTFLFEGRGCIPPPPWMRACGSFYVTKNQMQPTNKNELTLIVYR